jgi:hypothetical protein
MRAFNKRLSGVRIGVEHAFGMLKGRFRSLKEMGPHADIQEMYKAIEVLLILHNMCIEYGVLSMVINQRTSGDMTRRMFLTTRKLKI